jgi:hypothetical protein
MILDFAGRPLKRAIGFIGGFVRVLAILPVIEQLIVVGTDRTEDEEDED